MPRVPRLAIRAGEIATRELSTLLYSGGFEAKALIYETLVTRSDDGVIVPALAESWSAEEGGRTWRFHLRPGLIAHDGRGLTADDVRIHIRRWAGLPEHDWIPASRRIVDVEAPDPRTLIVRLDRPFALLPCLVAWNPCAVRAPGTLDASGKFVAPIGTGPFAFVETREDGRVLRLRETSSPIGRGARFLDLVRYEGQSADEPLRDLLAGRIDVLCDGWRERIPRERLAEMGQVRGFELSDVSSNAVTYLGFRLEDGPCADEELRLALRAALDRERIVARVELGWAEPCSAWSAPGVLVWPAAGPQALPRAAPARPGGPLRILAQAESEVEMLLAREVAQQLTEAGFPAEPIALPAAEYADADSAGRFELRVERTWGLPYDPEISLSDRWLDPLERPSAASRPRFGRDPVLRELVEAALSEPDEHRRRAVFVRIQSEIDRRAPIVPLYVSRRAALVRRGLEGVRLLADPYRLDLGRVRWGASAGGP